MDEKLRRLEREARNDPKAAQAHKRELLRTGRATFRSRPSKVQPVEKSARSFFNIQDTSDARYADLRAAANDEPDKFRRRRLRLLSKLADNRRARAYHRSDFRFSPDDDSPGRANIRRKHDKLAKKRGVLKSLLDRDAVKRKLG